MNIRYAGGSPDDFSANNIIATATGGSNVLLTTVPANPIRARIEVQNQSVATVYLIRDDGSDPTSRSVIALAPASGAGLAGGSWASHPFKGRLMVYAPTGSAVSVFTD